MPAGKTIDGFGPANFTDTYGKWVIAAGSQFGVTQKGALYCSNIHATGGSIANWDIRTYGITHGVSSEGVVNFNNFRAFFSTAMNVPDGG
jgi:hypothetical protein